MPARLAHDWLLLLLPGVALIVGLALLTQGDRPVTVRLFAPPVPAWQAGVLFVVTGAGVLAMVFLADLPR